VPNVNDFGEQINSVHNLPGGEPNPDSTLYVIFFGIEDYELAQSRGESLVVAAQIATYNILRLSSSPTFAKNFLVVDNYGRGSHSTIGEDYKEELFSGLEVVRRVAKANVGFVDLSTLWDGVLGSTPGYEAFGYTNPGACLVDARTTVGACEDPARTFYWAPGLPTTGTHKLISDYVEQALTQCQI
jgi:hypothetical protein